MVTWFDKKLPVSVLMHLLRPFSVAVNLDYAFHPKPRSDEKEEELRIQLQNWCKLLCAHTAVDVLQYAVQIEAPKGNTPTSETQMVKHKPNWKGITDHFKVLRRDPHGIKVYNIGFDWLQLPLATATFGQALSWWWREI